MQTKIWEGAIRISHWLMVLLIIGLFITGDNKIFPQHFILGKILLGVVIFRIIWGFLGSQPSRFTTGLRSLRYALPYMSTLFSRKKDLTAGHTPLGWVMTFLLIFVLGLQALLGLSMEKHINGNVYGHELSPLFSSVELKQFFLFLHEEILPPIIFTLVGIHILAILWYQWFKKQNLSRAMLTGIKEISGNPHKTNFKKLAWYSWIVAIISVGLVLLILNLANILGLN